jgi:hypothetical protein
MKWFWIGAMLAVLNSCLPGCTQAPPANILAAKVAIAESLLDPDSAKFRNVYEVPASAPAGVPWGPTVCGEVNATNAMGGYTGYKKFVYRPAWADGKDSAPATKVIEGDTYWSAADKLCGRDEVEVKALLARQSK